MNEADRWSKNYSKLERNILKRHKQDYLKCETAMDRKSFVGRTIFPELCAAWRMETGESIIPDLEIKIEKLLSWIRNNWRLTAVKNGEVVGLNIRPNTVIGELFRERINEEALRLMVVAKAANEDTSWLINWRKALTNVREGLTEDEKDCVKSEVERQSKMGLTLEAKRKFRHRHMKSRFDDAAEKNLKEMDVVTLTFIIHHNKEGEMEVGFHDKVAYLLGLPESFNMTSQLPEQVRQFKNAIADYFVNLKKALETLAVERGGKTDTPPNTESELMEGLPPSTDWHPVGRIPEPQELWFISKEKYLVLKDFDPAKVTKAVLEDTMRKYLSQNYYLATGSERSAVPWEQIMRNENIFFEKQYLSKKISLKAPRDMSKNDCVKFCQHVQKRQEEFKSMKDIFRFKMITGGRANTSPILPAMYEDDEGQVTEAQVVKAKPQKKKARIQNTGRLVFSAVATPVQLFQFESTTGPNHNRCNMGPDAAVGNNAGQTTGVEFSYAGGNSSPVDTNDPWNQHGGIPAEIINPESLDGHAANADSNTTAYAASNSSIAATNKALVNLQSSIPTEIVNPNHSIIEGRDSTLKYTPVQGRQRPLPKKKGINNSEPGNAHLRAPYMMEIYGNTENMSHAPAHPRSPEYSANSARQTTLVPNIGQSIINSSPGNRSKRTLGNADADPSLAIAAVTHTSAPHPENDSNRPRRVKRNADARALEEAANHTPAIPKRQRRPSERVKGH